MIRKERLQIENIISPAAKAGRVVANKTHKSVILSVFFCLQVSRSFKDNLEISSLLILGKVLFSQDIMTAGWETPFVI